MEATASNTLTEAGLLSFKEDFLAIEAQVAKAIIGQKEVVRGVLTAMVAGGNVLLEGLPGLGKTQMVKAFGQALALPFSRIQFTPDLMPADITGTDIYLKTEAGGSFQFQKGPLFASLVLADEINRATPKTQSALLEAMQEKTVTVGGNTYQLPSPFFVLATQNPLELEGTYPLPEAQLDRFIMKILVDFPTKEELGQIVSLTTGDQEETPVQVADAQKLLELNRLAKTAPIAKAVYDYAMELVLKAHPESPDALTMTKQYVRFGPSPRGAQALINVARIYALLDGRFNVAFEDIKKAALPTLRHRLFLNFEAVADGITADAIIASLL